MVRSEQLELVTVAFELDACGLGKRTVVIKLGVVEPPEPVTIVENASIVIVFCPSGIVTVSDRVSRTESMMVVGDPGTVIVVGPFVSVTVVRTAGTVNVVAHTRIAVSVIVVCILIVVFTKSV
jgi:hypothetical protein